jgi:hypothetical protein
MGPLCTIRAKNFKNQKMSNATTPKKRKRTEGEDGAFSPVNTLKLSGNYSRKKLGDADGLKSPGKTNFKQMLISSPYKEKTEASSAFSHMLETCKSNSNMHIAPAAVPSDQTAGDISRSVESTPNKSKKQRVRFEDERRETVDRDILEDSEILALGKDMFAETEDREREENDKMNQSIVEPSSTEN